MKSFLTIKLCALVLINLSAQDTKSPDTLRLKNPAGNWENWKLEFEDNFDSTALDSRKWTAVKGVPRDHLFEHSRHWFDPANIEVNNGTLKLWVTKHPKVKKDFSIWVTDRMQNFSGEFEYTTAEIDSKQDFGFGMYEIRCRLPRGKGLWPAFWMYGAPLGRNNEIDVFEFWNQLNFFRKFSKRKLARQHNMTVHFNGRMSGESYIGPDLSDNFHIFTCVWDECKILWYVDGELKRTLYKYKGMNGNQADCEKAKSKKNAKENCFPQDPAMKIIADVAVQEGEDAPDENTVLPAALEIDYIRFYRKAD